jgi:phosphoglycerol transferase MdoB-like AlkP superfamily enzyme
MENVRMKTKVTLSLDEDFVKEAKAYAKSKNRTLSAQVMMSVKSELSQEQSMHKKIAAIKRLAGSAKLSQEDTYKSYKQLKHEAYKEKFDLQ